MADGVDIFMFTGQYFGEQFVPTDVTHVRIDRSVKIIPMDALMDCEQLVYVETHNEMEKIQEQAFYDCRSLRGIKLPGVVEVRLGAFNNCRAMSDFEFSDKLETIDNYAFHGCHSLRRIKMPSVRTIGEWTFADCKQLTDVELPAVETIGECAFYGCDNLQRIAIPLKDNLFSPNHYQEYNQFKKCDNLTTVDLVGVEGIHSTISSLLMGTWGDEILQEIDRINQDLPNTPVWEQTNVISLWIRSVINRVEHYKAEHNRLLKEDMTQLELALWKAKLDEDKESMRDTLNGKAAKKAKIDVESMREERRITSGADIIIKNVIPFLQLAK
mmetsp:Transcript_14243/g.29071  ORF Transcript_14243/g.29071 Transcript_14243/m.29071 type:complete len:328 (+) Transcript_14243:63-1046(+)